MKCTASIRFFYNIAAKFSTSYAEVFFSIWPFNLVKIWMKHALSIRDSEHYRKYENLNCETKIRTNSQEQMHKKNELACKKRVYKFQ